MDKANRKTAGRAKVEKTNTRNRSSPEGAAVTSALSSRSQPPADGACLPKAAYDLSKQEAGSAGRNRQGKTPSVLQEYRSRLQDA